MNYIDLGTSLVSGFIGACFLEAFKRERKEEKAATAAAVAAPTGTFTTLTSASLDAPVASALTLGATNATAVNIGNAAALTSVIGALSVGGASTFTGAISVLPASNQIKVGAAANQVTLNIAKPAAAAQTYTAYDAGQSCNIALGIDNASALTASTTLSASQSGSTFSVVQNGTAAVVATLPAAAAGLKYRFLLTTPAANDFVVLSAGAAGTMKGALMSSNGAAAVNVSTAGFNLSNALRAKMVGGTAVAGDVLFVECVDGTNWIAHGQSGATNGNIFTV